MAIQPIAPLQSTARNLSALESILARGGSSFDSAISNAVQVGRDLANKQTQQERNFRTEQRREINLSQRRAENLQQDLEDARTFSEGKRRFDLEFAEGQDRFTAGIEQKELDRQAADERARLGREADLERAGLTIPIRKVEAEASLINSKRLLESAQLTNEKNRLALEQAKTKAEKDKVALQAAKDLAGQRAEVRRIIETSAKDPKDEAARKDALEAFRLFGNEDSGFKTAEVDEMANTLGLPKRTSRQDTTNVNSRDVAAARFRVEDFNKRKSEQGRRFKPSSSELTQNSKDRALLQEVDRKGSASLPTVKGNMAGFDLGTDK